jgi:hypothetical protein
MAIPPIIAVSAHRASERDRYSKRSGPTVKLHRAIKT